MEKISSPREGRKWSLGLHDNYKALGLSIPTEQHDAWVLKDLILIQFYTKSYIV